jgi:diaminopimelate epimerase
MRKLTFAKYHALKNDFLVIETLRKVQRRFWTRAARALCERNAGVGADGIVVLSQSKKADRRVDIFNADGSWAEKSGNGLRIAAAHLHRTGTRRKRFTLETPVSVDTVTVDKALKRGRLTATASLGEPEFTAARVPVRSRHRFHINAPLMIAGVNLPMTCLSVGNPHAVLIIDDFEFDWQALGADIEWSKPFPQGTNVEFVKVISRQKLRVTDWERGAGATGSSGTGAAAAVCALVMLGLADRTCQVAFESGALLINWRQDNVIELTGPVEFVSEGSYTLW